MHPPTAQTLRPSYHRLPVNWQEFTARSRLTGAKEDEGIREMMHLLLRKGLVARTDRLYKKPKPGKKRLTKWPRKLVPVPPHEQVGKLASEHANVANHPLLHGPAPHICVLAAAEGSGAQLGGSVCTPQLLLLCTGCVKSCCSRHDTPAASSAFSWLQFCASFAIEMLLRCRRAEVGRGRLLCVEV